MRGPCCCSVCGEVFTGPSFLTLHLKHKHTGVSFKRPNHSQHYSDEASFNRKQHGSKLTRSNCVTIHPRTCSSNLTEHLRIHSKERPCQCKQCGKTFTQSGHLTTHLRTHSGERPYECKQCGKTFTQSGPLTTHLRTHSGERPYECKQCVRRLQSVVILPPT